MESLCWFVTTQSFAQIRFPNEGLDFRVAVKLPVEKRVLMKNVPWWCKFHDVTTLSVVFIRQRRCFMSNAKSSKYVKSADTQTITNKNTSTELSNKGRYTGTTELLFEGKLAIIETDWICLLWTDFFKHFPFVFFLIFMFSFLLLL